MLLAVSAVRAENVDLSTVPTRNTVQLTIYNSEDLTLVRETRKVSFKPGANPLQFSWANTLIDPTSVELRFLTHRDKLTLLDTTFPHAKPQMLYWNVQSELDGEAMIEITYFTSGISWSADYLCIADPAETAVGTRGLREGLQQLRRGVRRRPGPAGRRPDQPGPEDRRVGPHHAASRSNSWQTETKSRLRAGRPQEGDRTCPMEAAAWAPERNPRSPSRSPRKG